MLIRNKVSRRKIKKESKEVLREVKGRKGKGKGKEQEQEGEKGKK